MITGFNHTSFTVADVELAVRFWTESLGFRLASLGERVGDWQGRATGVAGARLKVAHLLGHGHHMEFIQYLDGAAGGTDPAPNANGTAHVCLEVRDIEATQRQLFAAGARPQGEIVEVTGAAMGGCKAGYIRDPNGIVIELLELLQRP